MASFPATQTAEDASSLVYFTSSQAGRGMHMLPHGLPTSRFGWDDQLTAIAPWKRLRDSTRYQAAQSAQILEYHLRIARNMRAILFLSSVIFMLSGCAFDQRKDISYGLLYQPTGLEHDKAFAAAVSAKFPPGTTVTDLERFAASYSGQCWSKEPSSVICEIATHGQFCGARIIRIQATVAGSVINSTEFLSGGLGC